jgi:NitT/TauT family transport system permease protein
MSTNWPSSTVDAVRDEVALDPLHASGVEDDSVTEGISATRRGLRVAAPAIGLFGSLLIWQFGVGLLGIEKYVLPRPLEILDTIMHDKEFYLRQAQTTMWEALLGFVLAFIAAMVVATFMAHSRFLERAVLPLAVLVQVTPIIAYAPAIQIWQGYGFRSILVLTAIVCFVPFLINGASGLRSVDPALLELARSVNASKREVFFRLRLTSALPSLFSAARIAVGLALIGAVLGEFFLGSVTGLGYTIKVAQSRVPLHLRMWGAIYVLAVIGGVVTFLLTVAERLALHWHSSQREQ